ncbi:MAG: pyruvate formate-lyase-activating protein [Eubacteriales bacterium]
MTGRVHSFQSLGTVDGPSLRSVVFMQGCPLRCVCCHNPDTWDFKGGTEYTPEQLAEKVLKYKRYYGKEGGITVSGGEPLMQAEFVYELFKILHGHGISTCLDTSGYVFNDTVKRLLDETDIVLLDFKYTNEEDYFKYTRCDMTRVSRFLDYLEEKNIRTWLRYVVIPGLNDSEESVAKVFELKNRYACVEKVELLPFRKLCLEKYDTMGIEFPLKDTPEAKQEFIEQLYEKFDK